MTKTSKRKSTKYNYYSKAEREGFDKIWEIIQEIWGAYDPIKKPKEFSIPTRYLEIKGRSEAEIKLKFQHIQRHGLFTRWNKTAELYNVYGVSHAKLSKTYSQMEKDKKLFAKAFDELKLPVPRIENGNYYFEYGKDPIPFRGANGKFLTRLLAHYPTAVGLNVKTKRLQEIVRRIEDRCKDAGHKIVIVPAGNDTYRLKK